MAVETLSVDHRERSLIQALAGMPHIVKTLPVGDLVYQYSEHIIWIAERKSGDDLAKSIRTGRWQDQLGRLHAIKCRWIFFLVEGDLRSTSLPHASLLGACLNAELRPSSHVIRTADLEETAAVVRALVQKGKKPPGLPPQIVNPPMSKRQRDATREGCWVRQLMCVPSISERIAQKLLDEYGTLPAIQEGLADVKAFKRVRLDERTCLGTRRMHTLAFYLRDAGGEKEKGSREAAESAVEDRAIQRSAVTDVV